MAESDSDPYIMENHFQRMEIECEAENDELASLLYELTRETHTQHIDAPQPHTTEPVSSKLRLPKSSLPQFSVKYEDWGNFSDLFPSMIDEDKTLPNVVKLQYLKQCLTKEAADLEKDIKVEEANYKPTWEALKRRYCSIRLLIHTHFNTLYSLPKIQRESVIDLKMLIDKTRQAVRSSKNIGREVVGDWLVYDTVERLDPGSRRQWENYLSTRNSTPLDLGVNNLDANQYPNFDDLAKFIDDRIITLNMTYSHLSTLTSNSLPLSSRSHQGQKCVKRTFHNVTKSGSRSRKCHRSSVEHYIGRCPIFKQLSSLERRNEARRLKLCFNCLGSHQIKDCTSKGSCLECNQQHHTLLHRPLKDQPSETAISVQVNSTSVSNTKQKILLATACAVIEGPKGQTNARAMLDQGSEVSFISQDLVSQLGLICPPVNVTILGLGNHKVRETKTVAIMTLRSLHDPSFYVEFQAYMVRNLMTKLPTRRIVEIDLDLLREDSLADPYYYQPGSIQLIIGADYYGQLLLSGLYQIESSKAAAQKTALGWVISGPVQTEPTRRAESTLPRTVSARHCAQVENLQDELQRFWELENIPNHSVIKLDDEHCENHFVNTHARTPEGQYLVCLPKKSELPETAAETRKLALSSLIAMERRFTHDTKLAEASCDFMDKYKSEGHMKCIPTDEWDNAKAWYIHRAVIQQSNNLDWKLRVVFNASRLTSQKICLNDFLHVGPTLQSDISLILLNWRRHRIVFTADIVKMFRQILIHPRDRDFQRILWRPRPEMPIEEYRLCTVTYGTACAPFLAIRTLRQLSIDEGTQFPLGAKCLQQNTYVDDIFDGDDDVLQAKSKRGQVINLCAKENLKLDKWATNHPNLLPSSSEPPSSKVIDKNTIFKTLGILWNSNADHFSFNVFQETPPLEDATKRTISSCIAKLYDPLGWLSPITVVAKIMLQDIWILRINWDAELPTNVGDRWMEYSESLAELSSIKILRWLGTFSSSLIELHAWLNQHPSKWKTFVANRVSYIQTELPSAAWRYVPSQENPADLSTRGIHLEALQDHQLWWKGPGWLPLSPDQWPSPHQGPEIDCTEVRAFLAVKPEINDDILLRFSYLQRLIRVVAFCLRVFKTFRGKGSGDSFQDTVLLPTELESSKAKILVIAQSKAFAEDIASLKEGKSISKQSVLRNLNPFLDKEGILRVGGRLNHSSLAFSKKHPPILPKESPLAPLYVNLAHDISCHGGPKLTLSILRNFVWEVGAASLVRNLVRKCVLCHRVKPRFPTQLMGDLTPPRIEPARPLTNLGLDYAGPFQLRTTKGREFKSYKGYLVVFVCFATKAIHLEAVSDMTTAAFLAAYRRFIGQRGLCRRMYSDNGSTFQEADKELQSMFKKGPAFYSETVTTLANDGTDWHFIPPHSPHFGGLWEAGVKSAKHHLLRMMISRSFTFEEFCTLVEIEVCLNSRPLCAMSTDPEQLDALTPAHFLIGSTLAVLPDEPFLEKMVSGVSPIVTNSRQMATIVRKSYD